MWWIVHHPTNAGATARRPVTVIESPQYRDGLGRFTGEAEDDRDDSQDHKHRTRRERQRLCRVETVQ